MNEKSKIEILEDIGLNIERIEGNFILIKEQLSEFKKEDKIKINYKDCHVAICPNGGLIAICKKKGFLDITKGSKINKNIIVMNQNGKNKIYIPIDWNYNNKWIVHFEFNHKEQLYAICNDGSIYKIDILNIKAVPKISSEFFKNEEIEKCKLYKNGFIALTVQGNIYQIPDIKNPKPVLIIPIRSLLDFSNNIDFIIIPEEYSRTKKLELLITNDKDIGVIQVIKSEDGKFGLMQLDNDPDKMAYNNINVIKNDKIEVMIKENLDINYGNNREINKEENENNIGKILSIAFSPSYKKIALYNNKGHIILFDSRLNYLDKTLFEIKGDFTEKEKNELKAVINYQDKYQFLFCGEDNIVLSGQRFIFIVNLENYTQHIYKIIEGHEMEAIHGTFFSKCIQEIDGLRFMTNDGVFFITNANKELYDICDTFSKSNNKKLLKCYLESFNDTTNDEILLRDLKKDLTNIINNLLIASANIFWNFKDKKESMNNYEIYNKEKKEAQLFVLEAAQYAKNFVKSEQFNFDKFLQFCKDIRIVNNLRNNINRPKLITFNEYKKMDFNDLINKLMRNLNFGMAFEICRFLDYDNDIVYKKYCAYYIKKQKGNYSTKEELALFDILDAKLKKCKVLPYLELAKKAFKYSKNKLGLKFLEHEKLKIATIPQYMELNEWNTALKLGENTYNHDIILTIIDTLFKKVGKEKFISIVAKRPKIKCYVIKYLSSKKLTEQIKQYFNMINNPEELFFFYLEKYFQTKSISERKNYISLAKEAEKLITNTINPNFEHKFYKNYLDNLSNEINFKLDIMNVESKETFSLRTSQDRSFDISLYDTYKYAIRSENYEWLENKNKKFNFSHEGMNIMRCISYCESGKIIGVDTLLKKYNNNIKKLGLSYLNLAEIYFKFKEYKKAEENIKLINDTFYLDYKVDMLKFMDKYETALEIVIANKNNINRQNYIDEILSRKPELKEKANELLKNQK